MRRLSLSTILAALNVGALLVAVAVVAVAAVLLLQGLADDQALARMAQAGSIARREVNNEHNAVLTTAQLLAERPTLRRLLAENNANALETFLRQFAQTGQLSGAAVWRGDQIVAAGGERLPWAALWNARRASEPRITAAENGVVLLAAWQPVDEQPGTVVLAVQRLDARVVQQIGDDIGVPVTVVARSASSATDPARALREQALADGTVASARIDALGSYVAVAPLPAPDGTVVGLIETTLPTNTVAQSVERLITTLVLLVVVVGALATIGSFLIGRKLTKPLGTLTVAAARIGGGDLQTPLPVVGGKEPRTLAATLEDMRRRLLQLTADLRYQQAEAQAILSGMDEGVFTVDRERRIRYLNKQTAALLHIAPEAAIGRFCGDVLNPQGPNGVRPCAEHCPIVHARFRGGARAAEHLLLADGQRRTVVITSAPAAADQQVQVLRDETETEAVRRLRDTVLATISHEFRTPLSAQLASIELLLDQLPDLTVAQTEDLIRSLQRGTLRLTQLIDNLLESARLEAGQHTIRLRSVALDDVVEAAAELMRPLFNQRHQALVVDLPYPLPAVCGDAPRLTQVFVNLLANANKWSPARSTVSIGGEVNRSSVTLWVEDEGPGLSTTDTTALFGQFVRAQGSDPEQSGVGLGLWIVKSIVDRHGGTIDALRVPHGTRMCITLPTEQIQT